jgi:hypothetical protein
MMIDFVQEHNLRINTGSNLAGFVTDDEDTYTLCHCAWTIDISAQDQTFLDERSFEIIDMKFLRSSTYLTFFDYLDKVVYFTRYAGSHFEHCASEFHCTRSDGTVRQY